MVCSLIYNEGIHPTPYISNVMFCCRVKYNSFTTGEKETCQETLNVCYVKRRVGHQNA